MSDEPENLVLSLLRTIRTTQLEHGRRLSQIEIGIGMLRRDAGGDAEARGLASARMDALDERLERLEQRLSPDA